MSKAVAVFQEIQDPQESHLCKLFVVMVVPVWGIHSLDWFKKGFSDLELAATAQEEANGWHMLAEIHIAEGVSRPSSTTFPDISRHTSETAKRLLVFVFLAFNFISVFFSIRFHSSNWGTGLPRASERQLQSIQHTRIFLTQSHSPDDTAVKPFWMLGLDRVHQIDFMIVSK